MRILPFKIIGLLLISTSLSAQKENHRSTYNEEFNTNKDVVIDVDTRYTNVQIETWNKNKVSVEAIIEIEGVENDEAERTLENWKFNVVGNKSEVEISSKSSGASNYFFSSNGEQQIIVNGKHIELPRGDFNFEVPEMPEIPEMPDIIEISEFPEISEITELIYSIPSFDYDKYKKDKSYLKKWQKEMEENLKKNKIHLEKHSENGKEHKAVLRAELEKRAEQQKKRTELQKKIIAKHLKSRKEQLKKQEKLMIKRNENLKKYQDKVDKKRDIIRYVLADREQNKVKRTITIKAPKEAKFKMNVKYGTISFPN